MKVFEGLDIIKARPLGYIPGTGPDGLWWLTAIVLSAMVKAPLGAAEYRSINGEWSKSNEMRIRSSVALEIKTYPGSAEIDDRDITILATTDSRESSLAIVNALSSRLSIAVSNGGNTFTMKFRDSKMMQSTVFPDRQPTGTEIVFTPNSGVLPGPFDSGFFKSELARFSEDHTDTEIVFNYEQDLQ
jgi:DNA gyrase/topoisomerase IV subunit B